MEKNKEMENNNKPGMVLELIVKNHPGVMAHITGLFSRRGFNIEGILCGKIEGTDQSRIYLLVESDEHLEQMTKQLEKLFDVNSVARKAGFDCSVFERLEDIVNC